MPINETKVNNWRFSYLLGNEIKVKDFKGIDQLMNDMVDLNEL